MDDVLHYTLRKVGDPEAANYELTKWSDERDHPLEVYSQWIAQRNGKMEVWSCNCPSRSNPCKHAAISLALLDSHLPLEHLYYQDGVKEAYDL